MSLDRVLRLIVRNFSTLFLVVFGLIVPLHALYAVFFHDVFAVRELHPAIAEFPETRLVRGVGRSDVAQARIWAWVLIAVEVAMIPLVIRPLRRVLALDRAGLVPDAVTAWKTMNEPAGPEGTPDTTTTAACLAAGLAVGALVWLIASTIVELLPSGATAFGMALADATSRAAGAAFGLTAVALRTHKRAEVNL